jgi:hypothetical protein
MWFLMELGLLIRASGTSSPPTGSVASPDHPSQEHAMEELESTDPVIEGLLEFTSIVGLLKDCIIPSTFSVPAEMVDAIIFSERGDQLIAALRSKNRRMRPNEASMAVALAVGDKQRLYVEPHLVDYTRLRKAISIELQKSRILFPDLYDPDLSRDLFAISPYSSHIENADAIRILRKYDQGVYQLGHTTVGPFGCLESRETRHMDSDREVSGFYCENPGCSTIHEFSLATGDSAIKRAQDALSDLLGDEKTNPPGHQLKQFRLFAIKASGKDPLMFGGALIEFCGDALALSELQGVTSIALRRALKDEPALRTQLSGIAGRILGDPDKFVADLNRNQLLQILHLLTDEDVLKACDAAIKVRGIEVRPERMRAARLSRWGWRRAEASIHGVRFVTKEFRGGDLGHLLTSLYQEDPEELAYALGNSAETSLEDLISDAFQRPDLEEIVASCLSSTLSRARAACTLLHVDHEGLGKDELSAALKWRLGISGEQPASDAARISGTIEDYLSRSDQMGEDEKRGALSNVFTALETELMLALKFTNWAMRVDHYSEAHGFALYIEELPTIDDLLTYSSAKPTLQPLSAGLVKLSAELRTAKAETRPEDGFPAEGLATGRPFAFRHIWPFHDLCTEARSRICSGLTDSGNDFSRQEVLDVRNFALHGNAAFPSDDMIRSCLGYVHKGLTRLRELGLAPVLYERKGVSGSPGGRMEANYTASGAPAQVIRVPEWPLTPRMPQTPERVVIVPAAVGSGWGPLRFGLPGSDQGGDRWKDWPPTRKEEQSSKPQWAPRQESIESAAV